ncbi:MAG TPA: polyprenol phosphomannose-dependent alpha 1,6 mannosyltransferase MptB [Solirubrobacteraceae bacterium]|nr:polyprenol phosphomannose-dependent alpha 1,6 mannosyltransferase MptB [Solirubrobacteraceae bacterium]
MPVLLLPAARALCMSSDASTFPLRGPLLGGAGGVGLQEQASAGDEQARAATRRTLALGALALLSIVAGCALIVVVSADRPTFPPTHAHFFPGWLAGPLGGLWPGFPYGSDAVRYLFSFSLLAMYAGYLLGLRWVPRLSARWAIATVVVVHVLLFLAPPLALTDIFNYVNYGRMEVVHHLNPYTSTPIVEPHNDPSFDLSNWHHLLSPYGPTFTLITFAIVPLGVAASFWAIKLLLMLASLGTIWLVWKCARLLGREPVQAIVFVGLNPVVLVWGLGGDHNDFIMMFLIVLGFYLLLRGRESESSLAWDVGAGAAFVAAATVKASGVVLLPIVLAGLIYSPRRLLQSAAGMIAAGALLAAASVMAFGLHLPDLSTQSRLVTTLSPSNLLGLALGSGGATATLLHLLSGVLAASVLAACVMAWRKRDSLTPAGWASVALLLTLSWVLPWYVLWVLPMAALSRSRALRTTALVFGVFFVLAWAPLANSTLSSLGFHPERTALGKLHQRYVKELLN